MAQQDFTHESHETLTNLSNGVDGLLVRLLGGSVLQVEERVLEELLKAESLFGVRLEAADEEVAARLGELLAAGDDNGLPLLDLDQHLQRSMPRRS